MNVTRKLLLTLGIIGTTPASLSSVDVAMYARNSVTGAPKIKKNYALQCEFCKMKGHVKETCYKLIGYPQDRSKKKSNGNTRPQGHYRQHAGAAYNVISDSFEQDSGDHCIGRSQHGHKGKQIQNDTSLANTEQNMQGGAYPFTKDQYEQIINLLKNKTSTALSAAATGISTAFLASKSPKEWIINTGATNHMVADQHMLDPTTVTKIEHSRKVFLPNGESAVITHIGSSTLSTRSTIKNVLHLPKFQFNLMSVSKVTRESQCSVRFFPGFCLFQDLYNGKVKEIGKVEDGVYILVNQEHQYHRRIALTTSSDKTLVKTSADISLWHRGLGHVATTTLNKVLDSSIEVTSEN